MDLINSQQTMSKLAHSNQETMDEIERTLKGGSQNIHASILWGLLEGALPALHASSAQGVGRKRAEGIAAKICDHHFNGKCGIKTAPDENCLIQIKAEIVRALSHHPAEPTREQWQPIETAPSRQFVLVCNPSEGNLPVVAKRYDELWINVGAIPVGRSDGQHTLDHAPTHWMPLPALPDDRLTGAKT